MKNSEIAERAIEIMERDGWRPGWYGTPGEPGCLVGTVRKVLPLTYFHTSKAGEIVYPGIWDTWGLLDITVTGRVIKFNDTVLTTQEEAIKVLTKAAKHWRDKGE